MKRKLLIDPSIRKFLSDIGRMGGRKSKRILTSEQAREMLRKRWGKNKKEKE